MRLTAKQVAEKLGVSAATVSRVINNSGYVKPAVKARVETALIEMGYVPNHLAKSLQNGSTKIVGLVITSLQSPFFIRATEGIQDVLQEKGYHLLLCNTKFDVAIEKDNLQLLKQGMLDGIISTAGSQTKTCMLELVRQNYPVVFINRLFDELAAEENRAGFVLADLVCSGQTTTEYLLSLGHKHIGILCSDYNSTANRLRLEGHRQALTKYGLDFNFGLVRSVQHQNQGLWAYSETLELLQMHPEVTALLVLYHPMLPGVLQALKEAGRSVPDTMSLIGFDDFPLAPYLDPPLTVMAQPVYEMGRAAARLMLQLIENKTNRLAEPIMLKPELIIRRSCAIARSQEKIYVHY